MKKLVSLLVGLLGSGLAFGQSSDWQKNYEQVRPFCNVFIVGKADKMGLVDSAGKPVTRLVFDDIDELNEGYAHARIDGHQVFLHESGRIAGARPYHEVLEDWIKPPLNGQNLPIWAKQYSQVTPSAGVFIVRKFTVSTEKVIRGQHKIFRTERAGLINARGRPLTGLVYDGIWPFTDGRAMVRRNQKYGFLDSLGQEVVPVRYDIASPFNEGVATVNGWVIDRSGRKRFRNQDGYKAYDEFEGRLCRVSVKTGYPGVFNDPARPRQGRHNFINHDGKFLMPSRYDSIGGYDRGELRVVVKNGRYGLLDSLAQEQIPAKFQELEGWFAFSNADNSRPSWIGLRYGWPHHRRVKLTNRYGFLDLRTGHLAVSCRYQTTLPNEEGRIWVKEAGKWGLLDSVGREILPPQLAYDTVHAFREGRALVQQGLRYGYVDKSGRLVIPLRFWQADEFHNGKAPARTLFRRGLLRPDGSWFRSSVAAEWVLVLTLVLLGGGLWAWQRRWAA